MASKADPFGILWFGDTLHFDVHEPVALTSTRSPLCLKQL